MILVREYWPNFVERNDEPREVVVETLDEVLKIPWLIEKGANHIDGRYVMNGKWIMALLSTQINKPVVPIDRGISL